MALWPAPAAAQQRCGPRSEIVERLGTKYHEVGTWVGVAQIAIVELFTSADGGYWTVIVSYPNGTSCLLAYGYGWRALERVPVEPEPET